MARRQGKNKQATDIYEEEIAGRPEEQEEDEAE